jgi:hypothetical protein
MNHKNSELSVVYEAIDKLVPYSRNARTHSNHQIRKIANCIQQVGFLKPVLIAGDKTIIAGHGCVAAARLLGMEKVPTIHVEGLSEDQIRAYIIGDNRLAEMAGWDKTILAIELQHLVTINEEFDVTLTGFEIPEIDLIIEEACNKEEDKDDLFEIDETGQAVTQPGDLWRLGKHRIFCGDSLNDV